MSWTVIDSRHPGYSPRSGNVHGPLPVKRWVAEPGERYIDERGIERSRRKIRINKASSKRGCLEDTQSMNKRHAVEYAKWLAKRDEIELPRDGYAACNLDYVTVDGKSQRRIRSVTWRVQEPNSRSTFIAVQVINIPNWNHVPTLVIETIEPDLSIAA